MKSIKAKCEMQIKEGKWFTTIDEHGYLRRGKATQYYDIIEYCLGREVAIVAQAGVAGWPSGCGSSMCGFSAAPAGCVAKLHWMHSERHSCSVCYIALQMPTVHMLGADLCSFASIEFRSRPNHCIGKQPI